MSAHMDTFARDHLPPRELWPVIDFASVLPPGLNYPERLNCAVELLDNMVAVGNGDRIAIRFPGGSWTYRELMGEANRVARVLTDDLGLIAGNRVLLRGPNTPMLAACWFGVLKAGGICVTTMPLLRAGEICYMARKALVSLALCDARVATEVDTAASQTADEGLLNRVVLFNANSESTRTTLESLTAVKPTTFANVQTDADDVAIIAFTSGTTGKAKGTMHTHRDLLTICDCFPRHVLRPTAEDIFCGSPPLAFTFGLGGLLLFPLRVGASTLLLEQAAPPNLIQGIQDHRATVCFTAPTAYRAMAGIVRDFRISSLKKCVSAGEALPLATFETWREATGIEIIDGIGSTEMLHIFISAAGADIRPGSTGKAVPGYRSKVVDDEGNDVAPGTVGHLAVQGPTGCRYLDDNERQRAYVKNGWNLPGDSYRMDSDGYFWYQARTDDMIVSSGYKIAGPEVENALLQHAAVQECGVVGVPDEERGHVVKAFVVLRSGHDAGPALVKELQDFVKAEIAPYKYPRQIEFVPELPRTETGKLQRFRLRVSERSGVVAR
ncbi:MAG: benzoate-CoA ligase family protein [Gemmatimonadaceae bacterium]